MDLDPDDPRPPYLQIASVLRAAILTRKFSPGERLPSGKELAERYGVARMTVQQALRILREEGLVISRQGSGVFVRQRIERPIGLRPHVERAFTRTDVSIDFSGFSGETLHGALQEPLDKVRHGRLTPATIRIRILLLDTTAPITLPCRTDGLADDPDFRARATGISQRHTQAIADSVHELADLGVLEQGQVHVRTHRTPPLFKLYLLNGSEAFFGFYPVREHTVRLGDEEHGIYDLMGKDAALFHHEASEDSEATGTRYVAEATAWFESLWTTVSRDSSP